MTCINKAVIYINNVEDLDTIDLKKIKELFPNADEIKVQRIEVRLEAITRNHE